MNTLINGLQGVSAGALIGWIIAIGAAGSALYIYLEKYRKLRNSIDDYREQTDDNKKRISDLEDEVSKMKSTTEDSFKTLFEKMDQALTAIGDLTTYNKARDMSDLKDRIRHHYDVYHERKTITPNEKESLIDLISSYEEAGGKNSFVHTLVVPEMYTWEVLDNKSMKHT